MDFKTKTLLLILFTMKVSETASTRPSRTPPKRYDITPYINKTITKLFRSVKTMIVTHLLKKIKNDEPETYKYKLGREIKDFQDKMIIRDLTIYAVYMYRTSKYINYEFFANKIQLVFDRAEIHFSGDVDSSKDQYYGCFDAAMVFDDHCNITVTYPPHIELQCSDWNTVEYKIFNETVTRNEDLVHEIKSRLPKILVANMNNNRILLNALNKSYGFQPKKHIITKRRDFLEDEQQYYYRIPSVPYFCFNLKNITIRGLTNFHSLKYSNFPKTSVHTLLIRNIRGNATLDYGLDSEPDLELNFQIDSLTMSMDKFTERFGRGLKIGGHWCSVNRTKENVQVTNTQAEGIIRTIESAIATSIMPKMQVWKAHEMETPIGENCSEISQSTSWESMKDSYKKFIPFNDD